MSRSNRLNAEPDRLGALDGLRGCAIISVMLYHFSHVDYVSHSELDSLFYRITLMGWVGVDLFFVLSGYLITRILLSTRGAGGYFRNFYARRALRILPLYYGYLIVLALAFGAAAHLLVGVRLPPDLAGKVHHGFQGQIWF